jgi:uncharacterized protein (TIGR02147 family)
MGTSLEEPAITASPEPRASTRDLLRSAARSAPPSRFLDYKDFLRALHGHVADQTGRYPYVQFSRDLGFDRSNVAYVVLHGFRRLSREQAVAIAETLDLVGVERRFLEKLVDYTHARDDETRRRAFDELVALKERVLASGQDRLMLRFFSEWHHGAIFELVALPEFQSDPAWISSRFYRRLSEEAVRDSLALLTEMGLIREDPALGRHVKTSRTLSTGDEVRGLAVAGYHRRMLEMAMGAVSEVPANEREVGAVTLAVSAEALERLKADVKLFKRYAVFLSEQCETPERVVQLNLQLFSVTKA